MSRAAECFWGLSAALAPWFSPERLRRFQSARLRALVQHCWREVPLYRRHMEAAGVDPATFRGLEDLSRLPMIDRTELSESDPADVLAGSRPGRGPILRRTSGTSGVPLTVRRSWFEEWLLRGLRLQSELAQGANPLQSRFSVKRKGSPRIWSRLGLARSWEVDCLEPMPQIVAKLMAANPQIVAGYCGSVAALAAALPEGDRGRLHVRRVYCGAETMTPPMREIIRQAFGVSPLTSYASNEFNLIASECPSTGLLHVADGSVILEVLDEGHAVKEGQQGETVITALHSYAMPFVRFRLGDLVTRGPARCSCGAPYSTIADVRGRVVETFVLPGGRRLHPYAIVWPLVNETSVVRQYQIVQEEVDLIRVRLVGFDRATPEQQSEIEARLLAACGPDVQIRLEAVQEIRPETTRKFRPYYSLVSSPPALAGGRGEVRP